MNPCAAQIVGYYHDEARAKRADATDVTICGRLTSVERRDDKSFLMMFMDGEQMLVRADTQPEAQRWVTKIETKTGFSDAKSEEMPSAEEIDQVLSLQ